jgi:hypothetical protein
VERCAVVERAVIASAPAEEEAAEGARSPTVERLDEAGGDATASGGETAAADDGAEPTGEALDDLAEIEFLIDEIEDQIAPLAL